MSELTKPITAPHGSATEVASFGAAVYGGLHTNINTPLSESGSGKQGGATIYSCPNWDNCYGLNFLWDTGNSDGSDYLSPSERSQYLLGVSQKNLKGHFPAAGKERLTYGTATDLYVGVGNNFETDTYEIGNTFSAWGQLRIAGQFGIAVAPYFGIFNSIPKNSSESNNISMMAVEAGVQLRLNYDAAATAPPSERLNDYDLYYFAAATAHRLASSYATAKALNEKSAILSEAPQIRQFIGEESAGGSSQRLEGIPSIMVLTTFIGANGMGGRLDTHLKADADQRWVLIGSEAAATLGAFVLSANDESNTMLTQGMLGGMQLANVAIADRLSLNHSSDAEKALSFVMYQLLLQGAAFSLGWGLQDNKAGSALMMTGHQAIMANTLSPDTAETGWAGETASHLLTYSYHLTGKSNLVGYEQIHHMPVKNFYSSTGLYLQNAPSADNAGQNILDKVTSRDPFLDRAKAKLTAGLGLETKLARLANADLLGAIGGVAPLYLYEGGAPKGGVGVEERLILSWGKTNQLQVGLQSSQELLDGKTLQVFITPLLGATW